MPLSSYLRGRRALAAQLSTLTTERDRLSAQVRAMSGTIKDLNVRIDVLTGQVNALTWENQALADARPDGSPAAPPDEPAQVTGRVGRRRAWFLIVSNMRSGSTWLESLLGALPDCATDYEVKWRIPYTPGVGHLVLDYGSPTVAALLDRLESDAAVVGSKFVFDPVDFPRFEFVRFQTKIDPHLRILHLVRSYRDIFLSRRRGTHHRLNEAQSEKVPAILGKALLEVGAGPPVDFLQSRTVPPLECYEELKIYLQNDVWAAQLRSDERPYLLVGYDEVKARALEIARFIGSNAPAEAVDQIVAHPPILKLAEVEPEQLVDNLAELTPMFDHFEALRRQLIGPGTAYSSLESPGRPARPPSTDAPRM